MNDPCGRVEVCYTCDGPCDCCEALGGGGARPGFQLVSWQTGWSRHGDAFGTKWMSVANRSRNRQLSEVAPVALYDRCRILSTASGRRCCNCSLRSTSRSFFQPGDDSVSRLGLHSGLRCSSERPTTDDYASSVALPRSCRDAWDNEPVAQWPKDPAGPTRRQSQYPVVNSLTVPHAVHNSKDWVNDAGLVEASTHCWDKVHDRPEEVRRQQKVTLAEATPAGSWQTVFTLYDSWGIIMKYFSKCGSKIDCRTLLHLHAK